MTLTLNFRDILDLPEWRPLEQTLANVAAGCTITDDLRNDETSDPWIYIFRANANFEMYHPANDEWMATPTFGTAMQGTYGAGSHLQFVASQGPSGLVGAAPNASYITLATLPFSASVGVNTLANRGDGVGFYIRVMGNGAGGSGLTEVRRIVANTSGTTPTVYFDSPLTFTPQTTDHYELLSGRVYCLNAGALTAGDFKAYDLATRTISGNLTTTNLIATVATDTCSVMLDELYVPYDAKPGEGLIAGNTTYNGGLLKAIQATAANATTITGSGMPTAQATDEYKNCNIRIVEDSATPTAVGQRVRCTTHTSGATGVFTVASWPTATPSNNAKFVIENNNDLVLWSGTTTVTYSYKAGGYAADANWSTAAVAGGALQYANPPVASAAGQCVEACWSLRPDTNHLARQTQIVKFRAGASSIDVLDVATLAWTTTPTIAGTATVLSGTSCSAHDVATREGKYAYVSNSGAAQNNIVRNYRFDLLNRVWEPWAGIRYTPGSAHVGQRMGVARLVDGTTKVSVLCQVLPTTSNWFGCVLSR